MRTQLQTQVKTPTKPYFRPAQNGLIQRKCACGNHTMGGECEDCKGEKGSLQRSTANESSAREVPPIVHEVLLSPGEPLDPSTRTFMESRLGRNLTRVPLNSQAKLTIGSSGDIYEREADAAADRVLRNDNPKSGIDYDLSRVRLHTDIRASESAQALNALAYTVGQDIIFAAGRYAPATQEGKRLLAHELAHVIQQRGSGVNVNSSGQIPTLQRQPDTSDDDESGDEGEKKPKSPFDPPDQLGKCSYDLLHPEKFLNCCTEAVGDKTICTDQIKKFKDWFTKNKDCPSLARKPDGTCCPLPMIWDPLKQKCSKTITPFGKEKPPPLPPPMHCLPGEIPTLFGGCCRPGGIHDKQGRPCTPISAPPPAPGPVPAPSPAPGPAPVPTPTPGPGPAPGNLKLHFNLDQPKIGWAANEDTLLRSLTPADKSVWPDLVKQLQSNPSWKFQLVGKASPEGKSPYNLDLAKRRAQLVAKVLIAKGIGSGRIIDVAPECTQVETGVYTCGETGATGPEDRQVKVVLAASTGAKP